jgi:hypothetical protein
MKQKEKLKGMNKGVEKLISAGHCNLKVYTRTGHEWPEVE